MYPSVKYRCNSWKKNSLRYERRTNIKRFSLIFEGLEMKSICQNCPDQRPRRPPQPFLSFEEHQHGRKFNTLSTSFSQTQPSRGNKYCDNANGTFGCVCSKCRLPVLRCSVCSLWVKGKMNEKLRWIGFLILLLNPLLSSDVKVLARLAKHADTQDIFDVFAIGFPFRRSVPLDVDVFVWGIDN